jgi:hypothetical protein
MAGKLSILRLAHLFPGLGVALFGDTTAAGLLPGALAVGTSAAAANPTNPAAGFGAGAGEFMNELAILYIGYKPGDGSSWVSRGYPFRTYGYHAAIELTRFLVKKFLKKSWKMGPLKFP